MNTRHALCSSPLWFWSATWQCWLLTCGGVLFARDRFLCWPWGFRACVVLWWQEMVEAIDFGNVLTPQPNQNTCEKNPMRAMHLLSLNVILITNSYSFLFYLFFKYYYGIKNIWWTEILIFMFWTVIDWLINPYLKMKLKIATVIKWHVVLTFYFRKSICFDEIRRRMPVIIFGQSKWFESEYTGQQTGRRKEEVSLFFEIYNIKVLWLFPIILLFNFLLFSFVSDFYYFYCWF